MEKWVTKQFEAVCNYKPTKTVVIVGSGVVLGSIAAITILYGSAIIAACGLAAAGIARKLGANNGEQG
jgi:hypothetical protein